MGYYLCKVHGCKSSSMDGQKRRYFSFPNDPKRCRQWVLTSGCLDLLPKANQLYLNTNFKVCELHFAESDRIGLRLKSGVIPSLNLPSKEDICAIHYDNINVEEIITIEKEIELQKYLNINKSPKNKLQDSKKKEIKKSNKNDLTNKKQNNKSDKKLNSQTNTEPTCLQIQIDVPELNSKIILEEKNTESTKSKKKSSNRNQRIKEDTQSTLQTNTEKTCPNEELLEIPELKKKTILEQEQTEKNKSTKKSSTNEIELNKDNERLIYIDKISHHLTHTKVSPRLRKLVLMFKTLRQQKIFHVDEYQYIALGLYLKAPEAYDMCRKMFSLPGIDTLKSTDLRIDTNLKHVSEYLLLKFSGLKESEKYCYITLNEIPLKRKLFYNIKKDRLIGLYEVNGNTVVVPATRAYIVTAKGILSDWEQPITYCFVGENSLELTIWIDNIIKNITSFGLHVTALLSGQKITFMNFKEDLNVTPEKCFFKSDNKNIYFLFDVRELVKSLRDDFVKCNFEFYDEEDGRQVIASWTDVITFYAVECTRKYPLAPELTDAHVLLTIISKMGCKYATQLFSRNIVAAMSCTIESGQMDEKCIGTVKFIDLIHKSLTILNAPKNIGNKKKPSSLTDSEIHILNQLLHFLKTVKVRNSKNKDVTKSVKCLEKLEVTVRAIIELTKELAGIGFAHVTTSRLRQPAIIKHFRGKKYQKPTAVQFSCTYRKQFMARILKHTRFEDLSNSLDNFINYLSNHEFGRKNNTVISIGTDSYRHDLAGYIDFSFLCSYLLQKCHEIHQCELLDAYMESSNIKLEICADDEFEAAVVTEPPSDFVEAIRKLDECFKNVLSKPIRKGIGLQMFEEMKRLKITGCCKCFPIDYLIKFFIRLRIFRLATYNNTYLRNKSVKDINTDDTFYNCV